MLVSKPDIFALEAGRDFIFHFSPAVVQREYKSVEAIFVVITLFPHALEIILSPSLFLSCHLRFSRARWTRPLLGILLFLFIYLFIYWLLRFYSCYNSPRWTSLLRLSSSNCLVNDWLCATLFTSPLTAATFSTACHSEKERRNDILAKSSRDRLLESALCWKYLLETIIVHKLFIDIFKEVFYTGLCL